RFRCGDGPRLTALAVADLNQDPVRANLANVGPQQRLNLALAHPRVNSPKDKIGQPYRFHLGDGQQCHQILYGQEPLTRNSTTYRIRVPGRGFLDQTGPDRIVEDGPKRVELALDGAGCCAPELTGYPPVYVQGGKL